MMPIPAMIHRRCGQLAVLALLAGCTPLPDIALPAAGEQAVSPGLLPMDEVLAQAGSSPQGAAATAALEARAARLRARAAALRAAD